MWILIAIAALVVAYVAWTYNAFVSLRNRARNAWADIDVQLRRRYDLVPNLVATVKGYAAHERIVFDDVARLRTQAMGLQRPEDKAGPETQLADTIKTLFAVAESYPQLRADRNFRELQDQLSEIEEQLQYARRYYNAVVRDFDTKCEVFPSSLIASLFGFAHLPYFQAEQEARAPVQVSMGGGP